MSPRLGCKLPMVHFMRRQSKHVSAAALEFPANFGPLGRDAGDACGLEHSLPAAFSGISHSNLGGTCCTDAWCQMLSLMHVPTLETFFLASLNKFA